MLVILYVEVSCLYLAIKLKEAPEFLNLNETDLSRFPVAILKVIKLSLPKSTDKCWRFDFEI